MPNWVALYYDEPLEIVSGAGSRNHRPRGLASLLWR
jgi:hypothetical protein